MWDALQDLRPHYFLASIAILNASPSFSQTLQLPIQIVIIDKHPQLGLICNGPNGITTCTDTSKYIAENTAMAVFPNDPNSDITSPGQILGGPLIVVPGTGLGGIPREGVNSISEQQPFLHCAPPCIRNPPN